MRKLKDDLNKHEPNLFEGKSLVCGAIPFEWLLVFQGKILGLQSVLSGKFRESLR